MPFVKTTASIENGEKRYQLKGKYKWTTVPLLPKRIKLLEYMHVTLI